MREAVFDFFQNMADAAWGLEITLITVSWIVLCRGGTERKPRPVMAKELLLLLMSLMCVNLITVGLNSIIPLLSFVLLWGLAHGGVSLVYVHLCSPYQRKTNVLLWSSMYTAILILAAIAGQSSYLFGSFVRRGAWEGVVRCAIYLLMPAVALYLRRFNFDEYAVVPGSGLKLLLAGTASAGMLYAAENASAGALYVSESSAQTANTQAAALFLISYSCVFLMVLVSIRVIYAMCSEQTSLMNLQAEKQRVLSEREMTQIAERTLEDLRCIRHDLKNQYAYMQILLSEKRYDELQNYFRNLSENLPRQLSFVDCGNRAVNTVLNMELSKLKSDHISVSHKLVVPPALPFSDEDMCALLTNLLDNAIEECLRLLERGAKEAELCIDIHPHQSYLLVTCVNSTDRTAFNRLDKGLRTTKSDKELHGYGTRIVAKIAEKYNGYADFRIEKGRFMAQVMLDMITGGGEHDNQSCPV